jgi:hypothetical protein
LAAVTDAVRWYVLALSVIIAVAGTLQWRRWSGFKAENQFAWMAIVVLNIAIGEGTAELLWKGVPGGPRNYITAVGMTLLLYAVLFHPLVNLRRRFRRRRNDSEE